MYYTQYMLLFLFYSMLYFGVGFSQCPSNIACFAPPIDVAKLASHNLTVNSTCGAPPETFCVDPDCTLMCDSNNNQTWHPPSYLVDPYEKLTYWKSKNFDEPVFIQFDFGYKLILHQVIITFQFELPNGLYIQRSQDSGKTFLTLAYFAIRCNDTFGLKESSFYNGSDVLCYRITPGAIQRQISYAPRRDNYVAKQVLKGGDIRDYFLATNVKIVLQEFFQPSDFNRATADPEKFYFAIRDMDVQSACYCNGMTNQCLEKDYGTCICQKNTEGKNCEHCKKLYNNKPWTFGQACEFCNCNGHSTYCIYNAIKGYGLCQNCSENTKGDKCELCNTGYYRNSSQPITGSIPCISCNCFMNGVQFGSSVCHSVSGLCYCKSNVQGALCDECKDGYYGLSPTVLNGCIVCACSAFGTVNGTTICNKTTGVCPCKAGFTGRMCSDCKTGFYGYPVNSPTECRECGCHPSGSLDMTCDKSGQCLCRTNYFGLRCHQIRTGFFSASVSQMQYSSRLAVISSPVHWFYKSYNITQASGNSYNILGYVFGLGGNGHLKATVLTFTVYTAGTSSYEFFLQYMSSYNFAGVTMTITLQSPAFSSYSCEDGKTTITQPSSYQFTKTLLSTDTSKSFGSQCLMKGEYKVVIWFPPLSAGLQSSSAQIFILSLLVLPQYQFSVRYQMTNIETQQFIAQYYVLASSRSTWAMQELYGARYLSYIYGTLYNNAFACNCNSIGAINPQVCNIFGGQCNCKQNIYGRTCESCLPEHYNFTSGLGCFSCSCDPNGSLNKTCNINSGQCHCKGNVVGRTCNQCAMQYFGIASGKGCQSCGCSALYATGSQCDKNGNCQCKPGVGLRDCTSCAPGFYDLTITGCKACLCNQIGTAGNKCNPTTGTCTCKALVMGSKCEQCAYGYYGYSQDFPDTCLKCYCTGKTQECNGAEDYYLTEIKTMFSTRSNNNALQGWITVDDKLVPSGKAIWDWAPKYSVERGYVKLTNTGNTKYLYFSAPDQFLGDKRPSYMYYLKFDLTQQNVSNANATSIGDVIIKGKTQNFRLVMKLPTQPLEFQKFQTYTVHFYEKDWLKDTVGSGVAPTNVEMLLTLSNLEYILIRGKWTEENGQFVGLSNVIMSYSTYNVMSTVGLQKVKNVEYCTCPQQYIGQFCEKCNTGYTRSPAKGTIYDNCVACKCNGHSTNCNPDDGTCHNCIHHTEGTSCQTCVSGYYGTATVGGVNDCKECRCPGGLNAPNQFAKACILDTDNKPTCVNCEKGYLGRNCGMCSDGYHGNPMHPLGKCEKCICNNNINFDAPGNCNTTTGECLRCLFNTIGKKCEFCRPGYFGDALTQSCKECSCNLLGSNGNDCQNITGQCSCKPNVIGRICDECAVDTFNFQSSNGCELCHCNVKGSTSQQCNVVTGKCVCKARVIGNKCDKCAAGYYDLSKGCLPCDCKALYTVKNTTCDTKTGQCHCIESSLGGKYSGRRCNECAINAIGSPPNCELCHSPCYDNWQKYIEQEAADISVLQNNVTKLLSKFGGMSYESVQSHLTWLNGNLTYVMNVFEGAKYNTSAKEKQFKQIETHIVEFETVLNRTEQQVSSSRKYFETTVKEFNGTVSLSAIIPPTFPITLINLRIKRQVQMIPTTVDASSVTKMAQGFTTTTNGNNISGQAIYITVQNQFKQIVSSNTSISDAATKLAQFMSDLTKSAEERARVNGYLDSEYKTTFKANSLELKKIHDIVANIMILQNRTISIHQGALSTLNSAETVIKQAEQQAKARRAEAQIASQTVSQMNLDAVTLNNNVAIQKKVAENLKVKAGEILYDAQQEAALLAKGVTDIAKAKNKTEMALSLAYKITNSTMPVSLVEIQSLSNQIVNTVINEGVINATYTDAQQGLIKAKEVQARSQKAVDVSHATLQDIKNLENAINQSASLRVAVKTIQNENDVKIQMMQNISSSIETQFNTIHGQGGQTLTLLKSTLLQTDTSKMCFVEAQVIVDNATLISKQAEVKAKQALELHSSNERLLPTYATQINSLFAQTTATHAKSQSAVNDASELLSDVTEAEKLLSNFITQKAELTSLEKETVSLEAELNNLLLNFETERIKFSRCSRP